MIVDVLLARIMNSLVSEDEAKTMKIIAKYGSNGEAKVAMEIKGVVRDEAKNILVLLVE